MKPTTSITLALALTTTTVLAQNNTQQPPTGALGDAQPYLNNPEGAAYRAVLLPNTLNITGMITAVSAGDRGTAFAVEFGNLPSTGGPFPYHLHVEPVPSDGNCTGTLAHLDPYVRGEATPCVRDRPETCQVGDLSGKHAPAGNESATWVDSYTDVFVSLMEGEGAFFGNRSFVLHYANRTRIACGNFESLAETPDADAGAGASTETVSEFIGSTAMGTAAPTAGMETVVSSSSSSVAAQVTADGSVSSPSASSGPMQFTGQASLVRAFGWLSCSAALIGGLLAVL